MNDDEDLLVTNALTTLSLALFTEKSLKADLERLVQLAPRLIPTCSGASVSIVIEGEPTSAAVTDHVTFEVDAVQYDNSEGPCLAALGGDVIRVWFVPTDERFPHFAIGAADRRVLSVLSTPIIDHGTVLGTLNLYSQQREGFDVDAERIAAVLAAEAAAGIVKSSFITRARITRDSLQREHDEQTMFARAQGVLMAVHDCNAAQAANLIKNAAMDQNETIVSTAERILANVQVEGDERTRHVQNG